ncbi:hypothetical protein BC477_02500 [Clavibacter michiganensis subsp. michiganensis]|uniref:Uncharacterized protein n=2 Tax=Clavibacter michiganensis subsp. michiganensis TaxID=33013 RepID=A0A251XJQ6_CLAMM|nr:hypothetical protein [Clavibacter michiganensis]OUD86837.1 hypothetical protein BC477_02500 [Clavibacter michiganensis subsp. michiganensis]OUE03580.1 hypothetical protein CMMCAS07_01435 [Clavibacter michiganensis subsp. michiganensis]CAN02360.1 hypothetical protein CMM_2288 [Clavibacter michiganensis subsp. michiganensis NCPPB 382]
MNNQLGTALVIIGLVMLSVSVATLVVRAIRRRLSVNFKVNFTVTRTWSAWTHYYLLANLSNAVDLDPQRIPPTGWSGTARDLSKYMNLDLLMLLNTVRIDAECDPDISVFEVRPATRPVAKAGDNDFASAAEEMYAQPQLVQLNAQVKKGAMFTEENRNA